MKNKKFFNGTGLGSKSEPATRSSSAPIGAATGVVELDDASLASVSGGRALTGLIDGRSRYRGPNELVLRSNADVIYLVFDSEDFVRRASDKLKDLVGQDVPASIILKYLGNANVTLNNTDDFIKAWDG